MRIQISYDTILITVLLYPLLLFGFNVLGKEAFFLNNPYFFGVFVISIFLLVVRQKVYLPYHYTIIIGLIILSIANFSSLRYSRPIFFMAYIFVFSTLLNNSTRFDLSFRCFEFFLYAYLIASLPFLFLDIGWDEFDRFRGFVGSPTVYSGTLVTIFIATTRFWRSSSIEFLLLSLVILCLIYMTKTRLMLIFLLIFPLLRIFVKESAQFLNRTFYLLCGILFCIYPLYQTVIKWFPSLVTLRYENNIDSSFGLRNYLFQEMRIIFSEGSLLNKLFGQGNEVARLFVKNLVSVDLFPHNDFMRILVDWGLIGFLLFIIWLANISKTGKTSFMVVIVYMILFYSNMIFNLYLISILLLIQYHEMYLSKLGTKNNC